MNRISGTITVSVIALSGVAAVAAPAMAATTALRTPAAQADLVSQVTTPTVGVGAQMMTTGPAGAPDYSRSDVYIGTQDDGMLAQPFGPDTSRDYSVQFSNTGNVTENISVSQIAGTFGGTQVPSSWISWSAPASSLAPGAAELVSVTVTVPAGTQAGTYTGILNGAASAPGDGNVNLVTGAGVREYVTVS